jgi:hypothetical protein
MMVKNLMVNVYNEGQKVFNGTVQQFLDDNDNDEWLTQVCEELSKKDVVDFSEYQIGNWIIAKV